MPAAAPHDESGTAQRYAAQLPSELGTELRRPPAAP
jgi:hypothetical protein